MVSGKLCTDNFESNKGGNQSQKFLPKRNIGTKMTYQQFKKNYVPKIPKKNDVPTIPKAAMTGRRPKIPKKITY